MISAAPNPETVILGEWKELAWEYEISEHPIVDSTLGIVNLSSDNEECTIFHKAEKWQFLPNGQLKLFSSSLNETVNWSIKGRGNILQLKHKNGTTESYNLTNLDATNMILNFESDVHARGIAKLTFEKL